MKKAVWKTPEIYRDTLLPACIAALFCGARHAGALAFLAVPFPLFGLLRSAFIIWRQPERRAVQTIKILIWCVAAGGVGAHHYYLAHAVRNDADDVVAAIWQYQKRHGKFPADLSATGVNQEALRERWLLFYRMEGERQPFLYFADTFMPFEGYTYDFEKHAWTDQLD